MQGGLGGGLFSTPQAGGGLGGGLGRGTTGGLAGLGGGTGGGGLFGNRPGGLFGNTGGGLGGGGAGGSIFGQGTQTQTGGGLFNTGGLGGGTGGLFQTPTSQTGLGQQKTGIGGGLFGQSPALGGGLGGTGGGLFGQGAQTGATGAGGLFAKQTPASSIGGGLFKQGGLGGGLGGILGGNQPVKFEPIKAKDTANKNGVTYNVDTLLHCITGMSQYEQKSLEELRCEDYLAGRKGSSTTGGTAGGLFAAGAGQTTGLGTATTGGLAGGLFAQQNKSLAGGGLFNQQQTLGGLGGGVLGGGALGGASTGGGGLFAQQAQPKLGGGLFGAQNKLGLGGLGAGTAGAGGGGLFNQQTSQAATAGLFANQATTGGGLFNQQQASTGLGGLGGGLLGQPSQLGGGGGLFNRTTTAGTLGLGTGLGGLGTTTTGLGGGGLGAGGLGGLGALSQANTGFFNKPLQTGTLGGLGGGQVGLGLGGAGTLGATGLGGTSSLGLGTGLSTGLGQTQLGGGGMLGGGALGNQNQMANILSLESRREEINSKMESLANHPHGDHPLYRTALLDAAKRPKSKDSTTPVSAKATPTHSPHYKLNMRPSAKFKPLSLRSPARHINKNKLFESLEDSQLASESSTTLMGGASETFVPRRSIKKLTIKPKPSEPQPDSTTPPHSDGHTSLPRPQPRINSAPPTTTVQSGVRPAFEATPTSLRSRGTPPSSARSKDTSIDSPELTLGIAKPKQLLKPVPVRVTPTHSTTGTAAVTTTTAASLAGKSPSQSQSPPSAGTLVRSPLHGLGGVGDEVGGAEGAHPPPAGRSSGIVLTQQDYYTIPSCEELDEMAKDGHCIVEGFTIGRRGYGEIHFPDKTDVYGLNLDQLVIIGEKEVAVYPDDINKPPVGCGLNKVAIVRLHGNWPVDKTTREKVKDAVRIEKMGYVNKLKRSTAKIGGTFKDYDPDTGTCMFQVEHFSKYKLVADDDDSEGEEQGGEGGVVKKAKTVLQPQAKSGDKPPPVAPVQPVTQTSQSRLRLEDEAMSDEEEDASDVSTTTEPRPLRVLRSQHLASSMGVSSHAVQVMKASFFGEEPFSVPSRPPMFQTTPTPTSLGRDRSSLHHSGRHTPIPSLSSRQHPSGTTPHSMTPPLEAFPHPAVSSLQAQASVIMAKHNLSLLLPLSTSVVNDKTHNIADVGLTMGRSFRVGWGPNWTLAHSGYPVSRSTHSQSLGLFSSTDGGSSWTAGGEGIPLTVSVEQVRVDATKAPCKMGMTELFLRSQLEQSTFSKDAGGDSAPCIAPEDGHTLLERFADLARLLTGDPSLCDVATQRQWRRVINLVAVLWGPLPGDVDPDPASYDHQRARRKAIFLWLRETNEMITQEEVASCTDADYLRALFSLVSGQQLSKACRLAQKNRDHKLALLLSQATRNTTYIRTYLRHQLSDWEEQKANMFIEYERLKLYVVLAGLMVWETGTCDINVTEGLDWKRALALHLCYGCGLTASIKEVVDKFDDAFKDNVSPPPLPPYLERHREATPTSCPPLDTCYHLLQLYCYRDHSLEPTVAPSGSTPFQLDYRISWLLASLLGSLGYTHLHPTRQAQLHSSFGCQLERAGLWHWAVFVLLHINQSSQRELAVKSLLNAHCSSDADLTDLEAFVINELHVPMTWVYAAKGQSAGYELNYDLQAVHLLKAERWDDCHCVIVEKLAASAIINDETSQLLDMLEVLASHCSFIHNWEKAGSVFLDYLHISSRVLQLADNTDDLTDYLLDQLQSGVDKLAVRIHQLPCHTPTDVLCQTEIAKRTANYARVLADIKVEIGLCSDVDMTSVLPHLPLPSDYSLSEFSTLLQPFLKELGTHY